MPPIPPPSCVTAAATLMLREAGEAAAATRHFLGSNVDTLSALGRRLRASPPSVILTCARGSSDHAATFGKYLLETFTGVPVCSAAPSVSSVYAASTVADDALCLAISQSGRSPDLLATVEAHKKGGAHVVVLVNDETSPLADMADTLLPLCAGPERSVAATKSCIVSMVALAAIAAQWSRDADLVAAVEAIPDLLDRAMAIDWGDVVEGLADASSLFVIGRGYGLAVAQETALKLKETCALHAEAFSAAEVRHGPMTIVGPGFPILAFATSDSAGDAVRDVTAEFRRRGAEIYLADPRGGETVRLEALTAHPAIEPILMLQSFYRLANALSVRRGLDPDAPPHLAKVTRTL